MTPNRKPKPKKHTHKFTIERMLGMREGKEKVKGQIASIDLYCDCGLSIFVNNPTWHKGDMDEQFLTITDLHEK